MNSDIIITKHTCTDCKINKSQNRSFRNKVYVIFNYGDPQIYNELTPIEQQQGRYFELCLFGVIVINIVLLVIDSIKHQSIILDKCVDGNFLYLYL